MNLHSIRTIALISIMFVVSGLQAIHGAPAITQYAGIIDVVVPILLAIEHQLAGNSGPAA